MQTIVRQATEHDLTVLTKYVKPSVGRTFTQELDDQSRGTQSIFIALAVQQVVGWGFVHWPGPRDLEAQALFPGAPEIFRLEVLENLRSQGVGGALIQAMETAVLSRGFQHASLGVAHDNPRAYALYKARGYQDTELVEYYDEYQYPLPGGGYGTARDLCRYLVKKLS